MAQPSLLQEKEFDALVVELTHKLRPLAWRYSRVFTDLDIDDFLAIGLEGVAYAYHKTGKIDPAYLYGAAQTRMRQAFWSRTQDNMPTCSLDRYLYNRDTDRARYIAEDITTATDKGSTVVKARVAKLLATIPEKHQQLLKARYQVDDADTIEQVCERYNVKIRDVNDTCQRALIMCLRNSERQGVRL